MNEDFVYDIMDIAEDCYDLYVSDDGGYTWEYYGSYERRDWAVDCGEAACIKAETESYISHGK